MTSTSTPKTPPDSAKSKDTLPKKRLWQCSGLVIVVVVSLLVAVAALLISLENFHRTAQQQKLVQHTQQRVMAYDQQLNNTTVALSEAQQQITRLLKQHAARSSTATPRTSKPHVHAFPDIKVLYVTAAKVNVGLSLTMLISRQPVGSIVLLLDQAKRDLAPLGQAATTLTTLIAQSSQQIGLLPTLSPNAVAQSIRQLSASLSTLTLAPIVIPAHHKLTTSVSTPKGWQGYVSQSWQKLKQFLVIRHDDHLSQHLIYQSDRMHFVQLMHLYLQQAIWASWQGHSQQFQQNLAVVRRDISQFTQHNPAQIAWLKTLTAISKKPVAYASAHQQAALIQISHSLQLLAHTLAIKGSQHA